MIKPLRPPIVVSGIISVQAKGYMYPSVDYYVLDGVVKNNIDNFYHIPDGDQFLAGTIGN